VSQDLGTNIPPEYSKHYTVLEKLDELLWFLPQSYKKI
jgi:hypothetical protein